MIAAKDWGIGTAYNGGAWGPPTAETRAALIAAMDVAAANPVPPAYDDVRVLIGGRPARGKVAGDLTLEDGTILTVDGRLPADLPLGYHELRTGDGRRTRLIVSPGKCPLPNGQMWGWAAQLYALRSNGSWGIGDLADLARLAEWTRRLGGRMLLVNPLQAATPGVPQEPSPYYASTRRFLNPLYLHVEDIAGAAELGALREVLAAAGRALNQRRQIDRDAAYRLKDEAARLLWSRFAGDAAFDAFCAARGDELREFATFSALAVRFGGDYNRWPEPFRRCGGDAVRLFAAEEAREVRYHQWLQWLLDRQLTAAAGHIELMQDLPVGFSPGGADAWVWQDLLAKGVSVGAPPDDFNQDGQDWGLPAFVPHKLRRAGYEPFAQTIRAAVRHAAGLRIDHVMALFRLYWIPHGLGPGGGAYVRYRPDEMLAIVALESQRAGAYVVGEDLGNVEAGVREAMAEHAVLSYRLMWFEEDSPAHFPKLAMSAVTTHDLPTVAGLYSAADPDVRRSVDDEEPEGYNQSRDRFCKLLRAGKNAPVEEVIEGAYRALGQSPSLIITATLDDALAVVERPNMPGTVNPSNWSQALPGGWEALERSSLAANIAAALDRGAKPKRPAARKAAPKTRKPD